jgi:hypothetical protein
MSLATQRIGRLSTNQLLAITSAASVASAAVGAQTYAVLLTATVAAYVAVGKAPTAAATSGNGTYLPPNFPILITIAPGEEVAAIAASSSGSLSITEVC